MKMKRIAALCAVLLLCAALALPALAAYPAGIDETLPRVVDEAGLLTQEQIEALEEQARDYIEQYGMDLVILTRRGLGGKTPTEYADDFFDYEGYGWREEETDDITTGSGMILLVEMEQRDVLCSSKGEGQIAFNDHVQTWIIEAIKPQLGGGEYYEAFVLFLDECAGYLEDYVNGSGMYGEPDQTYNQGYYDDEGNYVYDDGYDYGQDYSSGVYFDGRIFIVALVIGLIIAWAVVASMKKKHNTIRIAQAAQSYQQRFDLTERQDIFLYSNTTSVRLPDDPPPSSGGGGGFSGGGSHTSSSGSSHTSVGSKF